MTKPINDFSDAKVGDKVTCYHLGHGEIVNVFASTWPAQVLCQFERENHRRGYRTDGRLTPEDAGSMLFKGHVEFPAPIPVKKKVKNTLWANIYRNEFGDYEVGQKVLHRTEKIATESKMRGKLATVKIEFEVEE